MNHAWSFSDGGGIQAIKLLLQDILTYCSQSIGTDRLWHMSQPRNLKPPNRNELRGHSFLFDRGLQCFHRLSSCPMIGLVVELPPACSGLQRAGPHDLRFMRSPGRAGSGGCSFACKRSPWPWYLWGTSCLFNGGTRYLATRHAIRHSGGPRAWLILWSCVWGSPPFGSETGGPWMASQRFAFD